MNCRRVINLLSAYIDGELAGMEMLEIRRHLSECEECREEYDSILATKHALSQLSNVAPREDFLATVLARLDEVEITPLQRFKNAIVRHFAGRLSPVAAALAVSALALVILSSGRMEYPVPEGNNNNIVVASVPFVQQATNIQIPEMPGSQFTSNKPLIVVTNDIPGYANTLSLASFNR